MTSYDATTYVGLSNAIQAFTEVDETSFVANIPNFIQSAENIINNKAQPPAFRKNMLGVATVAVPYLSLPADFLSVFSVAVVDPVGGYQYLLNKDVNYIREAFPYPAVQGAPRCYAVFDASTFLLGPTPNQSYSIELHYYAYPASIVSAGTTWVSRNFPNLLLWGSLTAAYAYLKGENDLLQLYQAKFEEALTEYKQLADSKTRQDAYRTVQVRDRTV